VYISDFDKAAHIGEGGATEVDDVYSFRVLLMKLLQLKTVDECSSAEMKCTGLKGLHDLVMDCRELSCKMVPSATALLRSPLFFLQKPLSQNVAWEETIFLQLPYGIQNQDSGTGGQRTVVINTHVPLQSAHADSINSFKESAEREHRFTGQRHPSPYLAKTKDKKVPSEIEGRRQPSALDSSSSRLCQPKSEDGSGKHRSCKTENCSPRKYPSNSSEAREQTMNEMRKQQRQEGTDKKSPVIGIVRLTKHEDFPLGGGVPLPSKAAMSAFIGKGGNGVVSYVYHKGKEFAVKETGLRDDELCTLRKLSHRNVMEISAVIEGERHERYHGGRTCYQLMPRVTGEGEYNA
jgi:hypothetical protein